MNTAETITPIIKNAYGDNRLTDALIVYLAEHIDHNWSDYRPVREGKILMTCWDWFAGGTTAANVADRIENALNE